MQVMQNGIWNTWPTASGKCTSCAKLHALQELCYNAPVTQLGSVQTTQAGVPVHCTSHCNSPETVAQQV